MNRIKKLPRKGRATIETAHMRTQSQMADPEGFPESTSSPIQTKLGQNISEADSVRQAKINTIGDINFKNMFKTFESRLKQLIVADHYDASVKQQWERDGNYQSKNLENGRYLLVKLSKIYFLIELCLFLMNVLMIWFISVQSVYEFEGGSILPVLWQIMAVVDILITLNTTRIKDGRQVRNRWGILKMYFRGEMLVDLLCIVCIVMLTAANDDLISIVYLVLMTVLFAKAYAKYINIKPFLDHNFAREHITLVTSFAFLIGMGHIFGLLMYIVGNEVNKEKNWINAIKIQNEDWATKYIFSIYWAFTTMVTVGYGDITPQNKFEAIVVVVVQILATSIFGYMINIIGMTLTELKSRNEALQTQLTITDKISKCFKIQDDLTYRIKSYLRNNHKVDSSFSLIQETKLVDKLNPVLKRELLEQTHTKIIKKSIFFLMHFTKNLQSKISVKLIKRILQPSEPIAKIPGQQAIYIINNGCIDLSIFRCHKNRIYSKKVRSISSVTTLPNGVCLNVYGYTELILGRMVNIDATSTTFTIAYMLKKKDFLEALSTCMSDYEAICQLKEKFFAKGILECIQVPELADIREHYYPHRYMLQRKNRVSIMQPRGHSNRRQSRDVFRKASIYYKDFDQATIRQMKEFKQPATISLNKIRRISNDLPMFEFNASDIIRTEDLLDNFQCVKSYAKFMINSNIEKVIRKMEQYNQKRIERNRKIACLMFAI